MADKNAKAIKKAVAPVDVKVNNTYTQGAYARNNTTVEQTAHKAIGKATENAESAYKLATKNNATRAGEASANNNTLTRQIGTSMKKNNYSLTNRNVVGAASARNVSAISGAKKTADTNANLVKSKSISNAKVSAYQTMAKGQLQNGIKDVERSTQLAVQKAQRKAQAGEAKKSRDLSNALYRRNKKYDKAQRGLSVYSQTIENRYSSVKAVNKAIKAMQKSDDKQKGAKLAYLRALKVKLQDAKAAAKATRRGGGRGGRRGYGRRGYGSGGSGDVTNKTLDDSDPTGYKGLGKGLAEIGGAGLLEGAGAVIDASYKPKKKFRKAQEKAKTLGAKGSHYSSGTNYARVKNVPSYVSAILKHVK